METVPIVHKKICLMFIKHDIYTQIDCSKFSVEVFLARNHLKGFVTWTLECVTLGSFFQITLLQAGIYLHFEWPNQNSKTTIIVQTFTKYGPYDFYLVNLSLLGAILAIFQFCGFWAYFSKLPYSADLYCSLCSLYLSAE